VRLSNVENAQFAADTMARIIRMSGARPSTCVSTFTVSAPTPAGSLANNYYSQLTINADWNPADCALTGTEENVTFSVANNNFYEDSAQASPVVDGISAVRFQFYDKTDTLMTTPASTPGSIGYVRIEVDTVASNGGSITIVSGASVRN
jgi:Tfp pilus assembly protein PilW